MDNPPTDHEPAALFVPDGLRLVPTARSRGPWSHTALHGGPVAALATRSTEVLSGDDGLQMVRLTLELIRPVPLTPLVVTSRLIRPGRRVQLVDTVVEADGVEVALARALRIRVDTDRPAPVPTVPEDPAPEPPDDRPSVPLAFGALTAFHNAGAELRHVGSAPGQLGPATVWTRLLVPVVPDEEPSPWQRAAAAADFGNGVASELPFDSGLFINPDLTVALHRPPVGEWVCLDARTRFGSPGIGSAESALWDVEGRIGRAVQNLVVDVRG
jgi:acyl-coenzyme A thioesterase PaaI-like protein